MAELICASAYMDQKEQIRVSAAKSLSTLIPLMSVKTLKSNLFFQSASNYEAYLILHKSLMLIITDENPEIRLFIINQQLGSLFNHSPMTDSPTLKNIQLRNVNDHFALELLFSHLTQQTLSFEETMDETKVQTGEHARTDALRSGESVPSGFVGSDFYLTEMQV